MIFCSRCCSVYFHFYDSNVNFFCFSECVQPKWCRLFLNLQKANAYRWLPEAFEFVYNLNLSKQLDLLKPFALNLFFRNSESFNERLVVGELFWYGPIWNTQQWEWVLFVAPFTAEFPPGINKTNQKICVIAPKKPLHLAKLSGFLFKIFHFG